LVCLRAGEHTLTAEESVRHVVTLEPIDFSPEEYLQLDAYVAVPISQTTRPQRDRLRILQRRGDQVFGEFNNPLIAAHHADSVTGYGTPHLPDKAHALNISHLLQSDFLLAILDTSSAGVGGKLVAASGQGLPLIILHHVSVDPTPITSRLTSDSVVIGA